MTLQDLDRLAEMEAKATKPPWQYAKRSGGDGKRQYIESVGDDSWERFGAEVDSDDCDYEMACANAALIPALRNSAKDLIAAARREVQLRQIVAALVKRIDADYAATWRPDHACAECVPGGELVRGDGFQCGLHAARAALAEGDTP